MPDDLIVLSFKVEPAFFQEIEDLRNRHRVGLRIPSRTDMVKLLLREGLTRMKALESGDVTATPTT